MDRCLDWRAASQASRGAVLRSAGDLCFLVILVPTAPLKSNMETKSKGLEDSFLLDLSIVVFVWEWRLPPAQDNQGEGYADTAIYIYQIYVLYIYIYYIIYIYIILIYILY